MDDQARDYDGPQRPDTAEYGGPTTKSDVPAIGVTFDQRLDDYRHVVFQSYVAADCSQAEMNGMLDKVRKAAERQKAIAHLPTLRGMLEDKEEGLKTEARKHLEASVEQDGLNNVIGQREKESDRRKPAQLSAQDNAAFARFKATKDAAQQQIIVLQKAIAVDKRNIETMEQLIRDGE